MKAEVVYSPMVAAPQGYQYNADAFEARGVDEVKQEAAHKEGTIRTYLKLEQAVLAIKLNNFMK